MRGHFRDIFMFYACLALLMWYLNWDISAKDAINMIEDFSQKALVECFEIEWEYFFCFLKTSYFVFVRWVGPKSKGMFYHNCFDAEGHLLAVDRKW